MEVEVEVLGEGGGGGGGFIDRLMRESKRNGGVGLAKLLFDFTVPPRWMCFFTLSTFEGLSTVFLSNACLTPFHTTLAQLVTWRVVSSKYVVVDSCGTILLSLTTHYAINCD